jgi:hypothetical protein
MTRKKKPLPLHVSLYRIQEERRKVALRTKTRVAQLLESENCEVKCQTLSLSGLHVVQKDRQIEAWNCYPNICCFCLSLLAINLLFLQWLYIQVPFKV